MSQNGLYIAFNFCLKKNIHKRKKKTVFLGVGLPIEFDLKKIHHNHLLSQFAVS